MMRSLGCCVPRLLLPLLALSWMGCSHLTVTVRRYDTAADQDTLKVYSETHPQEPTIRTRLAELSELSQQVRQYEQWVISLNKIATQLNDNHGGKTEKIQLLFAKFQAGIDQEVQRLQGAAQNAQAGEYALAPSWNVDFAESWSTLRQELEQANVELDPSFIERAAKEDVQRTNARLTKQAQSVLDALHELVLNAGAQNPASTAAVGASLQRLSSQPSPEELRAAIAVFNKGYRESEKSTAEAVNAPAQHSADMVRRDVEVYQDPTDAFLAYIARHPNGWFDLGNHSNVDGDGDTEFVLVFESPLDSRFKLISVDPSKVIMSRLRIARKAAQAAIAVGGLAMGSFGVPLPENHGSSGAEAAQSIDYSRMTAEEAEMRDSNSRTRARIEKLRNWAASQGKPVDAAAAQRTLDALVRELQALGPVPE